MLPDLNNFVDEVSAEEFSGLAKSLAQVFSDLKKKDINHITLGDILLLVGYTRDDIDAEDFEIKIDLTKGNAEMFSEKYLDSLMQDKLY